MSDDLDAQIKELEHYELKEQSKAERSKAERIQSWQRLLVHEILLGWILIKDFILSLWQYILRMLLAKSNIWKCISVFPRYKALFITEEQMGRKYYDITLPMTIYASIHHITAFNRPILESIVKNYAGIMENGFVVLIEQRQSLDSPLTIAVTKSDKLNLIKYIDLSDTKIVLEI